jgi:hypothetical protein
MKTRNYIGTACKNCVYCDWSTQLGDAFCKIVSIWTSNWKWRAEHGCQEDHGSYENPILCDNVNKGTVPCPHYTTPKKSIWQRFLDARP